MWGGILSVQWECIPGFLMCDGEADFPENDDEANCRK